MVAGKVGRSRFQIYFRADLAGVAEALDVKGEGKGGTKDAVHPAPRPPDSDLNSWVDISTVTWKPGEGTGLREEI